MVQAKQPDGRAKAVWFRGFSRVLLQRIEMAGKVSGGRDLPFPCFSKLEPGDSTVSSFFAES